MATMVATAAEHKSVFLIGAHAPIRKRDRNRRLFFLISGCR
jgi:hypothetical protein